MIWTLEPTSPWRITAADWNRGPSAPRATVAAPAPSVLFLEQFDASDRDIVEQTVLDASRNGHARCACRLASSGTRTRAGDTEAPAGLLEISLARPTFTESARALVARWTPSDAPRRVVDDVSMRQFLGAISHDLRTPLNGVLGMSRLLLDSGLRGDQIDYARAIDTSAEQLLTVIEDLLEFATLDTRTTLYPVEVEPRALVAEVIASLAARAAAREIEICALISANVPELVQVDAARLRQVLGYLVDDGIGRTMAGDVIVRVGFDSGLLRCEVSIDEPAWSDAPRPRPRGLSGLQGLAFGPGDDLSPRAAVCRHLVSLMAGTLEHRADPTGGVSHAFTVRVTPLQPSSIAVPPRFVSLAGRRVLCVDDEPVSRRVLIERLRGWNLTVEVADEAHAALTMMKVASAAGAAFELVIIDLRLPGVDGFSLARLIRADPALAHTRLILLTGYPARGQAEIAHEAGIDAYLQKPIREAPLRAALEALLHPERRESDRARLAVERRYESDPDRSDLRPRVLVAEDHPLSQKVTVQLLEKLGCRVDVVSHGEDAVMAVERTPYHLVLMECRLPRLDGAGATRAIRQLAETAAFTPILAIAREDDEEAREAALAAGVNDVMAKPLRLVTLREKLAHWIAAAPPR